MTEGYSGADLNVIVRDACYEPMRKSQRAVRFKQENDLYYYSNSTDANITISIYKIPRKGYIFPDVTFVLINKLVWLFICSEKN